MTYETINVRLQDSFCFIQINRPEANNTINGRLVSEFNNALSDCEDLTTVVILSGSPEVFCFGADLTAFANSTSDGHGSSDGPGSLYDLWIKLATGPYVVISHVRGKTNAGGIGFVAASDIVIADDAAHFSLSELLFGLYPACVLPFLIRRIGFQKANYFTLMTQPIPAAQAYEWGLIDAFGPQSDVLLRRHLLRLRRLSKTAIRRYKTYMNQICKPLADLKSQAVAGNLEVFSDPSNVEAIARFVKDGVFPWEEQ